MVEILDKRDRAQQFRDRLSRALRSAGTNQTALARAIGVDRSTLSQALSNDGPRLPGAHVVAGCADVLGVSADWLLSLSDRPESAQDLATTAHGVEQAPRALIDEQIFEWHREAQGYKIRHVPAGLPDMLKTEAMLEWEYRPHLGRSTRQAIQASADRLTWMRKALSDYEIAVPMHELDSFVTSSGYYEGLPQHIKTAQLEHFIALCDQLYPRLRLYLYDARQTFSAPITIFGPLIAVVYVGGYYLTFRNRDRVETLTTHFDTLVKEAVFTARDAAEHMRRLTLTM